jgi:hypothetical protein
LPQRYAAEVSSTALKTRRQAGNELVHKSRSAPGLRFFYALKIPCFFKLVLPINSENQGKTMKFKIYSASYNPPHLKSSDIGNTNLASKTGIAQARLWRGTAGFAHGHF